MAIYGGKTVYAGVAGLGDGGLRNLKGLQAAGVEVTALYDIDRLRARALATHYCPKAFIYDSVESFVRDTKATLVVVATPDDEHLAVAKAALENGKHVFVEKPLATKDADLWQFVDLREQYPNRLYFSEKWSFGYPIQATLSCRAQLGDYMSGFTSYTMADCDRIMGGDSWRIKSAYNPCAGGLSHNFMVLRLLIGAPITAVVATGQVLTYEALKAQGGFDTMQGILDFANGAQVSWLVSIAISGPNNPLAHRTGNFMLQFRNGALMYGPQPEHDRLMVAGEYVSFLPEASAASWRDYDWGVLYKRMHQDTLRAMMGWSTLHTVSHGINVAAACCAAFTSASRGGEPLDLDKEFQR